MIQFIRNACIIGGTILLICVGAGVGMVYQMKRNEPITENRHRDEQPTTQWFVVSGG